MINLTTLTKNIIDACMAKGADMAKCAASKNEVDGKVYGVTILEKTEAPVEEPDAQTKESENQTQE